VGTRFFYPDYEDSKWWLNDLDGYGGTQGQEPITAVPFAITAPGTYVLSSNLTSFASQAAITISSPVAGQVILDLGGFTLQFNPNFGPGFSGIVIQANSTASNITVRNGTVEHFGVGVDVNPLATGSYGFSKALPDDRVRTPERNCPGSV
jgi:hypothetical protein